MELITSFFQTSEMAILLVPAILVLVIALIVVNKHKKLEVITPMPLAPVTTTPTPAAPSEIAQQAIPVQQPVTQVPVEPVAPVVPIAPAVPIAQVIEVPQVAVTPQVSETPSWRPAEHVPVIEEEVPFVKEQVAVDTAQITESEVVTTQVVTEVTSNVVAEEDGSHPEAVKTENA